MEENINRTNQMYGGLNPQVSRVFFTHGQLDPWRLVGIQENLNEHAPATVVPCKLKYFDGAFRI